MAKWNRRGRDSPWLSNQYGSPWLRGINVVVHS